MDNKFGKKERKDRLFKWWGDWFKNSQNRKSKAEVMRRFDKVDISETERKALENELGAEASKLLLEVDKL